MSIPRLSQESTHCQLSSCGFELPACGEQESNYSTAPFSQLSFYGDSIVWEQGLSR